MPAPPTGKSPPSARQRTWGRAAGTARAPAPPRWIGASKFLQGLAARGRIGVRRQVYIIRATYPGKTMRLMSHLALLALAFGAAGCRTYELYPKVTSQKGLVPADQFAAYGHEQAAEVAIGREFAAAYQGKS